MFHGYIQVWVLTGDKQETAVEIAMTCRLITERMQVITLNSDNARLHYDKGKTIATVAHHRAARREVRNSVASEALTTIHGESHLSTCGFVMFGLFFILLICLPTLNFAHYTHVNICI